MPQLQFTIPNFSQTSTWSASPSNPLYPPPHTNYSTPTTATDNRTFALTGLPSDAILDGATLYSLNNSPYTGAAIKRIDSVGYTSGTQKDVLEKLQWLSGNYASGVTFEYKFKAYGGAGDFGYHDSVLNWQNNLLTVDYHMPASTFTAPSSVNVATNAAVTITPSGSYSHKVIASIGGNVGTPVELAVGVNSANVQFPAAWIPNATSAAGTIKVETYNGTTKMGETTANITVNVPNSAPYLPTSYISAIDHIRGTLPSDWPYTKGKSRAQIGANCSAGSGASIVSVNVSGDSSGPATLYSGDLYRHTSGFLNATGLRTFTVTVTDSRGRTAAATNNESVNVYDYYLPSCVASTALRSLVDGTPSDSGTYITVNPQLVYATVNSKNSLVTKTVQYRLLPSGSWSTAQDVTHNTPLTIGADSISTSGSYEVKFTVRDELYPNVTEGTHIVTVGSSGCVWSAYKKERLSVFDYVNPAHNGFEIGKDKPFWLHGQDSDARYVKAADARTKSTLQGSSLLTTIAANTTRYVGLGIHTGAYLTSLVMPYSGTLKNLYVYTASGAPGAGQSYTFTLMVNNAETSITCAISGDASSSANDTTHTANVTAGQRVALKCVFSSGAAANYVNFALEYDT